MAKEVEFKPQVGESPRGGVNANNGLGGEPGKVQVDAKTMEQLKAAVERANAEAGYDVAMAYAALNTLVINEQQYINIPRLHQEAHMTAVADIMLRMNGGVVTAQALGAMLDIAVAYGWHWAKDKKALLVDYDIRKSIERYIDGDDRILVGEKEKKRDALVQSFRELSKALRKVWGEMRR